VSKVLKIKSGTENGGKFSTPSAYLVHTVYDAVKEVERKKEEVLFSIDKSANLL